MWMPHGPAEVTSLCWHPENDGLLALGSQMSIVGREMVVYCGIQIPQVSSVSFLVFDPYFLDFFEFLYCTWTFPHSRRPPEMDLDKSFRHMRSTVNLLPA